jgi:hypothetical protein
MTESWTASAPGSIAKRNPKRRVLVTGAAGNIGAYFAEHSHQNYDLRLDISDARALVGYQPQDDLTEENPKLKELHLGEKVSSHSRADREKPSGIRDEL